MNRSSTRQALENARSLPEAFFASISRRTLPHMVKQAGRSEKGEVTWSELTGEESASRVLSVATYLRNHGIGPGSKVAIISATRVEWSLADLAILSVGGVTVSIYPSSTWNETKYILEDAQVSAIFIENREQLKKLEEIVDNSDKEHLSALASPLISFEATEMPSGIVTWQEVVSYAPAPVEELSTLWGDRSSLASLVYTSGTTGTPKGVIQSHGNHLTNVRQALESGVFEENGRFFLYLPLAHSFARLMHYVGMLTDVQLCYPSIPDPTSSKLELAAVAQDLGAANPCYLPTVPRLFEKIRDSLEHKASAKGVGGFLLRRCLTSSQEMYAATSQGRAPSISTQLWYFATEPVRKGIKRRVLGDRFRHAIAGGAKLPIEVNTFFEALGITILEGYGLTETCVATHANLPHKRKIGTVGPAFPDVEVKISETGEILMRGPNVSSGYYNLPEETAKAWDDEGWFHTGDLGSVDTEGFLSITGRIKELIVTAGGKKIAPLAVEGHLQQAPAISHLILFGEGKPYLIGLATLLYDEVKQKLLVENPELAQLSPKDFSSHALVHEHVWNELLPLNEQLSSFEQIKKLLILPEEFTVENELLTPTQKPRRSVIFARFKDEIEALYADATHK